MSWRRRDFLTRMFLAGAAGLTLACGGVYWRVADPSQSSQSSKISETPYDSSFFAALSAGSASSAAQILPEVVRLIAPKSAVDLGSGTGEWLGELRKLGVIDVMGVDGDWVDRAAARPSRRSACGGGATAASRWS